MQPLPWGCDSGSSRIEDSVFVLVHRRDTVQAAPHIKGSSGRDRECFPSSGAMSFDPSDEALVACRSSDPARVGKFGGRRDDLHITAIHQNSLDRHFNRIFNLFVFAPAE